ncbi:transcription elongation factor Spt6 [Ramaria rubella]|nr:transcription elongation factor Spt6 [Ramaria rubella]
MMAAGSDADNGEPTMVSDDSSEEPEEDEEEERRVREGFIADDDEDDDEGSGEEAAQRRRRKKRRRRNRALEEDLEEDDLDLLEENTGTRITRKNKLTRLRRGRESESPVESRDKQTFKSILDDHFSDEEDDQGADVPTTDDVRGIWDDDRVAGRDLDDDVDMDDDFIDDDLDDDGMGDLGEEEREERRKERLRIERERRKALGRPDMVGIDASAWDEIFEVFGDGTDYDWALEEDDVAAADDIASKPEMRYQDVFEPSEIRARLLTEDDDWIRAKDIPERMQLVTSALSESVTMVNNPPFPRSELSSASEWVALRISRRIETEFFLPDAKYSTLLAELIMAVQTSLDYLLCQNLEVPYIYTHRRDYISYFDATLARGSVELLRRDELWRVYALGQRYRALVERKKLLDNAYQRLAVTDEYFENDIRSAIDSIEVVADTTEWLSMKYKDQKADATALRFHDDEEPEEKKMKMPSRISAYEIAKKTPLARLARDFGIAPHNVVLNFFSDRKLTFPEDPDVPPLAYAEQYTDMDATRGLPVEDVLKRARMIVATELGRDPLLRKEIRSYFKTDARVSVSPTEKGVSKIDDHHKYYNFKYLLDKPITLMTESPQFLHILAAEADHLVTVDIHLPTEKQHAFQQRLVDAYSSDSYSDTAKAWNDQRAEVVREAMEKYLLPAGSKWAREWIREEVEDFLAANCGEVLEERINVQPFRTTQMEKGQTPSVLAVSWGKGDPQVDAISLVFLDDGGRLREHSKLDNLSDEDNKKEFEGLLERRSPDVIVVGGFSGQTTKLMARLKELISGESPINQPSGGGGASAAPGAPQTAGWGSTNGNGNTWGDPSQSAVSGSGWGGAVGGSGWGGSSGGVNGGGWGNGTGANAGPTSAWGSNQTNAEFSSSGPPSSPAQDKQRTPVIYVHDDSARIYQHSKRASEEFSALSLTAKYCVGLARYTQCPMNEYAALGRDMAAITYDEDSQQLIPKEKLLTALERALVNIVNAVGVDINRAVNDSYYQLLLPYIAGLGPRKAQVLIKKIIKLGGTLVNRDQFIKNGLLTTQVYLNAAGFLRIRQDPELRDIRKHDVSEVGDPLDDTRVHPEDYELARKMATDALELDDEDVHDDHPSHVISLIMQDKDNVSKLDELNLDDFAVNMYQSNNDLKRHTLNVIKDELLRPFREVRMEFRLPSSWDVLTMLTGETERTLRIGLIVSAMVVRLQKSWIVVKLDSGIEGIINAQYLSDHPDVQPNQFVKKGQTLQGVIIQVNVEQFQVELSSRPADVSVGDASFRRLKPDQEYYDVNQAQKDHDLLARKKRREVEQARRVIKHPDFHNFNSAQAEAYLAKQQRGDVVIRPSSKGMDHLAVTWKVDDGVYQHIDVVDENADPNLQAVGNSLVVDNGKNKQTFSDLDELIVNYVQAMARKTEELMAHEKFKGGNEDELHAFLKNFVSMNPNKSVYAFGLNRKKPGHFNLAFLANKTSVIQTWPVRVSNASYFLFDTEVPTVPSLCDAFKYRHIHESQNPGGSGGGKTPYGGRTPARTPATGRTPGHVTPGHHSVRVPPPSTYGQPPTSQGYGQPPYPGYPPPRPSGGMPPNGVHPSRAAMIQNNSGWGQSSGNW